MVTRSTRRVPAVLWRWPVPALLAWGAGWLLLLTIPAGSLPAWCVLLLAWAPSLVLASQIAGLWRRSMAVAGLPLALWVQHGASAWPSWAWLALGAVLLAVYPVSAWRDAPLFPTPPDALGALARRLSLPGHPRVLDAGSGLGHGLTALRQAFPLAALEGVERSALLVLLARIRMGRGVRLHRGDMWQLSWGSYDLVYLFQRPESMPGAWEKACSEMRFGSWLVSLEFPVPGIDAEQVLEVRGTRPRRVYAYRVVGTGLAVTQSRSPAADKIVPGPRS